MTVLLGIVPQCCRLIMVVHYYKHEEMKKNDESIIKQRCAVGQITVQRNTAMMAAFATMSS